MTIEQRLAEIIQAFGADALSSAVNLNGDLDVVLCVLAQALTAAFRARLPGNYAHATPDTPARSSATATASPSRSTAAPTHQSSATPASPTTPPSPGGADASSASSSPDPRAEVPVRKSALTARVGLGRPRAPRSLSHRGLVPVVSHDRCTPRGKPGLAGRAAHGSVRHGKSRWAVARLAPGRMPREPGLGVRCPGRWWVCGHSRR